MSINQEISELRELLSRLCDDVITEKEITRLEQILNQTPESQTIYLDYMRMHSQLHLNALMQSRWIPGDEEDTEFLDRGVTSLLAEDRCEAKNGDQDKKSVDVDPQTICELLEEFDEAAQHRAKKKSAIQAQREAEEAERKRRSEAIELRRANRRPEPIVIPWCVVYATVGSLAAGLVLLVYSLWPQPNTRQPMPGPSAAPLVATVADSVDAEWSVPGLSIESGSRLPAGKLFLTQGFVELAFDGGASTLIESPAELELISADQAFLVRGRLVGCVPPKAFGFTIQTPSATIVDIGTEFGIDATQDGISEVQVLRGIVEIGANLGKNASKATTRFVAGSAVQIDQKGAITEVAFDDEKFIKRMPTVVNISKVVPAGLDARLVDLDKDGKGDRVDLLDLPPVTSEVTHPGKQDQPEVGVGERNVLGWADQDQRKYWIAYSLTQTECEEISEASSVQLAVTLSEKNNVSQGGNRLRVDVYGVPDPLSLNPAEAEFESPSALLVPDAINEYTALRKQVFLDVTEFVKLQVAQGNRIFAFRLQTGGIQLPNHDGVHNSYVFFTKQSDQETFRPALHMRLRRYQ